MFLGSNLVLTLNSYKICHKREQIFYIQSFLSPVFSLFLLSCSFTQWQKYDEDKAIIILFSPNGLFLILFLFLSLSLSFYVSSSLFLLIFFCSSLSFSLSLFLYIYIYIFFSFFSFSTNLSLFFSYLSLFVILSLFISLSFCFLHFLSLSFSLSFFDYLSSSDLENLLIPEEIVNPGKAINSNTIFTSVQAICLSINKALSCPLLVYI